MDEKLHDLSRPVSLEEDRLVDNARVDPDTPVSR
jgi:hypothetical protein